MGELILGSILTAFFIMHCYLEHLHYKEREHDKNRLLAKSFSEYANLAPLAQPDSFRVDSSAKPIPHAREPKSGLPMHDDLPNFIEDISKITS